METLVSSPASPPPNGVSSSHFSTVDPTLIVEHLAKLIEANLGATRRELENIGSLLSKSRYSETVQRCTRFATESQAALYVQKDIIGIEEDTSQTTFDDQGKDYCILSDGRRTSDEEPGAYSYT